MHELPRKPKYINIVDGSGYHTEQQKIMNEKIQAYQNEGYSEKDATNQVEQWVALPKTSNPSNRGLR